MSAHPKKLPSNRHACLAQIKALDKPWFVTRDIPNTEAGVIQRTMMWCRDHKYVKTRTVKGGKKTLEYQMTPSGHALLKALETIDTFEPNTGSSKGGRKKAAPPAAPTPALNLSNTADGLANSLAGLLQENSNYRTLMLNQAREIIIALDIQQEEIYGQGNAATS